MDAAGLGRFICGQGADLCYHVLRATPPAFAVSVTSRAPAISRAWPAWVWCLPRVAPALQSPCSGIFWRKHAPRRPHDGARSDRAKPAGLRPLSARRFSGNGKIMRLAPRRAGGRARTTAPPVSLEEISVATASQLPSAQEFPELSWAISRHAIAKMVPGRGYSSGRAVVVIGDPEIEGPFGFTASPRRADEPDWAAMREALAACSRCIAAVSFSRRQSFPRSSGRNFCAAWIRPGTAQPVPHAHDL